MDYGDSKITQQALKSVKVFKIMKLDNTRKKNLQFVINARLVMCIYKYSIWVK